jgi:hypothetical protein
MLRQFRLQEERFNQLLQELNTIKADQQLLKEAFHVPMVRRWGEKEENGPNL